MNKNFLSYSWILIFVISTKSPNFDFEIRQMVAQKRSSTNTLDTSKNDSSTNSQK